MFRAGRASGVVAVVAALISLAFVAPASASVKQGPIQLSDVSTLSTIGFIRTGEYSNKVRHPRQEICAIGVYNDQGNLVNSSGRMICDFGFNRQVWPDGHEEYFVIGTDYAVYHIHEKVNGGAWSGWEGLGGETLSGVGIEAPGSARPSIEVVGMNGLYYYRSWTGSSWAPWKRR